MPGEVVVEITVDGTYTLEDEADKEVFLLNVDGGADVTFIGPDDGHEVGKIKIDYGGEDSESDTATIDLQSFYGDLHIDVYNYDPSDSIILDGQYDFVEISGGGDSECNFTYTGEDGNTHSGFLHLKDDGEKDWYNPDQYINICFVKGSLIQTPKGDVPVENLKVGDLVITKNYGLQSIRWIGSRQLDSIDLAMNSNMTPFVLAKVRWARIIPHTIYTFHHSIDSV